MRLITQQRWPYPDTWLSIIGAVVWAHFVKAFGCTESIFELFMTPGYFPEVMAGAAITWLIWAFIRQVTIWLDWHFDWLEKSTQRAFLQLVLGVGLPALLVFFAMYLFFDWLVGINIFQTPWLVYEYRVTILFLLLLNGYYLGFYFYNRFRALERTLEEWQKPGPRPLPTAAASALQSLIAQKGSKNIPVSIQDIAYCFVQNELYYLKTFDDQQFLIQQTLDELSDLLPLHQFFRVNRQLMVNLRACESYKNIENGKLQLMLKPATVEPVRVSQKKAAAFKEWLVKQ